MDMAEEDVTRSLENAQRAAAYLAARLSGDTQGQAALVRDLGTPTEALAGMTRVAEQLAVDIANLTGRAPAEVASLICTKAALGVTIRRNHPSAGPAGPTQ